MSLFKLLLIFGLTTSAFASEINCVPNLPSILNDEDLSSIEELNDKIKQTYKRRAVTRSDYHSLLNIDTNFDVPLVGKDQYFGRVYIVDGKPDVLKYRDELIADRRYKEESKDESIYYFSEFKLSDINSAKGLSLIKAAGAEVTLRSTNFSTTTGGRLYFKVKGPGDAPQNLVIDVKITKAGIENFLVIDGQSIPFDSMKINTDKSFMTGTSILAGVKNVEFSKNGKVTKVMEQ